MMVFATKEGDDGTWWLKDLRYVLQMQPVGGVDIIVNDNLWQQMLFVWMSDYDR